MIQYCEQTKTFFIETKQTSYVFKIFKRGSLLTLYYGKKIPRTDLSFLHVDRVPPFGNTLKNEEGDVFSPGSTPTEYPVFGLGDLRTPALYIQTADGDRLCELRYRSHTIRSGKPPLEGLPSFSAEDGDAQTLEILLRDDVLGLEVTLSYTAYEHVDLIARHAVVTNTGEQPIRLLKAASLSLDLPDAGFQMIKLHGSWARERSLEVVPLGHGVHTIDSKRGTSSHQMSPFMALSRPGATEDFGEVYGFSLVYSGSFEISAEVDDLDTLRVQLGINPFEFSWLLEKGQGFCTPEAVMAFSDEGLGGMSRVFHTACVRHLGRSRYRNQPRPIILNNWEATRFDFTESIILDMIESCRGLGIDIFVLDDGWFGERDDDTSSLGDWFVNRAKLPGGLEPLTKACREAGMKFGLWIEPGNGIRKQPPVRGASRLVHPRAGAGAQPGTRTAGTGHEPSGCSGLYGRLSVPAAAGKRYLLHQVGHEPVSDKQRIGPAAG